MAIYGLDRVNATTTQSAIASGNDYMDKDDFLTLLVAQLQHQDPMSPMESTDFTAQLAQFSSLEQLQNISSNLGTLNTTQAVSSNSQAVSFIGKNITAVGDTVQVQDGDNRGMRFSLDSDAASASINIYDQNRNFVRQIETGVLSAGENSIAWDGQNFAAEAVSDGTYTFKVNALDANENSIPVTQFVSGLVTGVTYRDGMAYLQCGDQQVAMGNVVNVLMAEE